MSERNPIVPLMDVARALKAANGDVKVAALALGMKEATLHMRIQTNTQLRSIWKGPDAAPSPVGVVEEAVGRSPRTVAPVKEDLKGDEKPDMLAQIISREDQMLLRSGLAAAGIEQKTIDRLATLQGMELSGGKFLITSVDLAHRMMVLNSVSLFEEAENIRTKYLHNDTIKAEDRMEWHKIYNQISELMGRFSDRTMAATSAMAMMLAGGKGKKQNGKRHFAPLRNAPPESRQAPPSDPQEPGPSPDGEALDI